MKKLFGDVSSLRSRKTPPPLAPLKLVAPSKEEISKEIASDEKIQESTDDPFKAAILMRSTPVDERSDSWSDDEYESSDLEVGYDTADEEMDNQVILSRVRRLGRQKGIWSNSVEFYSVALSFLISPDALVSAIYGFRKFGSKIMYPTMFGALVLGFPVMFMELALGQYTSTTPVSVFRYIAPAFSAITAVSTWMNIVVTLGDISIFAMTVSVLKDLLETQSDQLMATSCFNSWNSLSCQSALNPCTSISFETGLEYIPIQGRCVRKNWYTDLLSKDIRVGQTLGTLTPQFKYLVTHLTSVSELGHFISYFPSNDRLIFVSCIFSVLLLVYNLPKKAMVFYAKIPLLMIVVFFGTTILCSSDENLYSDYPGIPIKHDPVDWDSNDFRIWLVGHVFLVSKIGQGCLITIGSANPFRSHLFIQVFVLVVFAFSVPYLIAYLIYPYMDKLLWNSIGDWNDFNEKKAEFFRAHDTGFNAIWSDVLLAFFSDEENGELLGGLFIFTLISIFTVHKLLRIKTLVPLAVEAFGITSYTDLGIFQIALLGGLQIFYYNKQLIPNRTISLYVNMSGSAFVVLFEIICVFVFYGPRRLLSALNLMTFGISVHNKQIWRTRSREWFNLMLAFIFATVAFLVCPYILIHVFWSTYVWTSSGGNKQFAVFVAFSFFGFIPLYGAYQIWQRYRQNHLIINLFKPIPDLWGPREDHDRRRAEYQERQMRVS